MMQPQASDEGMWVRICVCVGAGVCVCGSGCWTSGNGHNNELQKEG